MTIRAKPWCIMCCSRNTDKFMRDIHIGGPLVDQAGPVSCNAPFCSFRTGHFSIAHAMNRKNWGLIRIDHFE